MKTFKILLKEIDACSEAKEWAGDMTIEEIVQKCYRGDWLLWLAARVGVESRPLTLAKGYCANTVRHLMEDERSVQAVDAAIAYGEGKIGRDKLDVAYASDAAVAYAAADAYSAAAAYASCAHDVYASAAAAYASAADNNKEQNQLQTANICRKYIGQLIIDKVNQKLNEI
jgi:hypothetical protein